MAFDLFIVILMSSQSCPVYLCGQENVLEWHGRSKADKGFEAGISCAHYAQPAMAMKQSMPTLGDDVNVYKGKVGDAFVSGPRLFCLLSILRPS
jgi:hypothetical protein